MNVTLTLLVSPDNACFGIVAVRLAMFRKITHPAPETRSLALALAFYVAGIFAPFWAGPFAAALPDRFLFYVFLGFAILFQTDALSRWQMRGATQLEEPRHMVVFLLTSFGGGILLAGYTISPEIGRAVLISISVTLGATVLVPGLKHRLLGAEGDERYRQSQLRAREAGLRALTVMSALLILIDLSGLVIVPLWLGVGVLSWGVASTVTGVMWWLER